MWKRAWGHQDQARPLQRGRRIDGHRLHRRADGRDGSAARGTGPRRRVGPRRAARAGHGCAALSAGRRAGNQPIRWRASPGGAVQTAVVQTRPVVARRADQPPRRGKCAVARTASGQLPRCDPGGHPRPLLPGQRRGMDPGARSWPRLPYEATTRPIWRKKPSGSRCKAARTRSCKSG